MIKENAELKQLKGESTMLDSDSYSYSASDSDIGSIGMYSGHIEIGHFLGIGQCEYTVILDVLIMSELQQARLF